MYTHMLVSTKLKILSAETGANVLIKKGEEKLRSTNY